MLKTSVSISFKWVFDAHTLLLESLTVWAVSHIAALSHVCYLFMRSESLTIIIFHTFNKPEDFKASVCVCVIFFQTEITSKKIKNKKRIIIFSSLFQSVQHMVVLLPPQNTVVKPVFCSRRIRPHRMTITSFTSFNGPKKSSLVGQNLVSLKSHSFINMYKDIVRKCHYRQCVKKHKVQS